MTSPSSHTLRIDEDGGRQARHGVAHGNLLCDIWPVEIGNTVVPEECLRICLTVVEVYADEHYTLGVVVAPRLLKECRFGAARFALGAQIFTTTGWPVKVENRSS